MGSVQTPPTGSVRQSPTTSWLTIFTPKLQTPSTHAHSQSHTVFHLHTQTHTHTHIQRHTHKESHTHKHTHTQARTQYVEKKSVIVEQLRLMEYRQEADVRHMLE